MKSLFRFELRKLLRQKSYYVCLGIILLTVVISVTVLKIMSFSDSEIAEFIQKLHNGFSECVNARLNVAFELVMSFFIAYNICGDFDQSIIKGVYSRGYSRRQYYLTKLCLVLIATIISFFTLIIFTFILYSIMFGVGKPDSIWLIIRSILLQLLYVVTSTIMVVMLCFVFKKSGGVIAFCAFVPNIVDVILSLISSAIFAFTDKELNLSRFWLVEMSNYAGELEITNTNLLITIFGLFIYGLIFGLMGYYLCEKTDL